jgi:Resolvase, N terminal domain
MSRAVLYARVSTDRQKELHTIESQQFELKCQIAAAGRTLVKEYIDDGYCGAYLNRPVLLELLAAAKTDAFDAWRTVSFAVGAIEGSSGDSLRSHRWFYVILAARPQSGIALLATPL